MRAPAFQVNRGLLRVSFAAAAMLVLASPALAHYSYRGCDAQGCWHYQCDAQGRNCTRTPLNSGPVRYDPNRGDYRYVGYPDEVYSGGYYVRGALIYRERSHRHRRDRDHRRRARRR